MAVFFAVDCLRRGAVGARPETRSLLKGHSVADNFQRRTQLHGMQRERQQSDTPPTTPAREGHDPDTAESSSSSSTSSTPRASSSRTPERSTPAGPAIENEASSSDPSSSTSTSETTTSQTSTLQLSTSRTSTPQPSSSTMPHLSPAPTTTTLQTPTQIATHLESVVRNLIYAINTRTLTPTHPLLTTLSPSLSLTTDCMPATTTLKTSLSTLSNLLIRHPQHHMHLSSVKGNVVNIKAGYADVYCRVVVTGVPREGFRGHMVVVWEFRLEGGSWRCVKVTGIRGLPDGGAGCGAGTPTGEGGGAPWSGGGS